MLYWLTQYLSQYIHAFQVFRYLTFRGILGSLTALLISLIVGPIMIRWLKQYQIGQQVRNDGPQSHLSKSGTPTMGGTLIILSIGISMLLWCDLANQFTWIILLVLFGFSAVGFIDDYKKVMLKNSKGLSARLKILLQSILAIVVAVWLYTGATSFHTTELVIPFFKDIHIYLGIFFILLSYLVIVGSSNAVNLTDGLDGLAIMPTVLVAGALGIFAYLTGNYNFATYLSIPYVPGVGEAVVACGSIVGAGLGFLWFNTYPAQVFMGDVGSLGLGAVLGVIAVIVRQELVLFIMGGIFVIEAMSVILQVGSFKLRGGKRIFRMAPIHHHFELKGWPEPRVIVRFWIITVVLVLIGLSTLKLR